MYVHVCKIIMCMSLLFLLWMEGRHIVYADTAQSIQIDTSRSSVKSIIDRSAYDFANKALEKENNPALKAMYLGDVACYTGKNDDAAVSYETAFKRLRDNLDLSEMQRFSIERRYNWAANIFTSTHRATSRKELIKELIINRGAINERRVFTINLAQQFLHHKITTTSKDSSQVFQSIMDEVFSPVGPWDSSTQGSFVISFTTDQKGRYWVGTEDNGVWMYDPWVSEWQQFTAKDGLGDNNAYALLCDKLGRVWVGHLNHGVSVYNGKSWRNYDVLNGPLGCRVFAFASNPTNGDVWIGTDAGLTRYSIRDDAWSYFTQADGLPSNQIYCLACDKRGTLYVGTDCNGIAVGTRRNDYKTWRLVTSSSYDLPIKAADEGLPSNLINCLLVTHDNTVWAGTSCGLAFSRDSGIHWHYTRGQDWADKLKGLQFPPPFDDTRNGALLEDHVTCLTESDSGLLYIGYREKSYEVVNPSTAAQVYPVQGDVNPGLYMSALLPIDKGYVLMGRYGDGLRQGKPFGISDKVIHKVEDAAEPRAFLPILPTPASPSSISELNSLVEKAKKVTRKLLPGHASFLGDDWVTGGDWVGRYGCGYAVLCAAGSPFDHEFINNNEYKVSGEVGHHHTGTSVDQLRHWLHFIKSDNPRTPYDPIIGYRRMSVWDDHGEVYPRTFEGPDQWITIDIPEGTHRLSVYFINKDGHGGDERFRDYVLEIKHYNPSLEYAETSPTLARTRVRDYWGGVYKCFLLCGPARYYLKVAKNNSMNTEVCAVMLDGVSVPSFISQSYETPYYGGVNLVHPVLTYMAHDDRTKAALNLWESLDKMDKSANYSSVSYEGRLLAFRILTQDESNAEALTPMRSTLNIWFPSDRENFKSLVKQCYQGFMKNNPQLIGVSQ